MTVRKRYPADLKAEVTELIRSKAITVSEASAKYSIPAHTLYGWSRKRAAASLSSSSKDSKDTLPENIKPKLAEKLSMTDALTLWGYGRAVGFDSPEFGLKCRQMGVKAEEIAEFESWLFLAEKHKAINNCLLLMHDLKESQIALNESKHECSRCYGEIARYEQRIKDKDATISEMTTELFIRKKILTILS